MVLWWSTSLLSCYDTLLHQSCDDLLHQCYMMTYLIAVMWPTSPLLCDDLHHHCYMMTYFTTVMWWPISLLSILWWPTSQPWCCDNLSHLVKKKIYVWFKYDLGQKYHAPQVQPGRGLNSWPPDHDSTFHVTETPATTTRPSVTSPYCSIMNTFCCCCAVKFALLFPMLSRSECIVVDLCVQLCTLSFCVLFLYLKLKVFKFCSAI